MKKRILGKSVLEVSALGFGCMGLNFGYGQQHSASNADGVALIVPIPGATKLHRLKENVGAADVELTADDPAEIQRAAGQIAVEGERYPPALLATTGR